MSDENQGVMNITDSVEQTISGEVRTSNKNIFQARLFLENNSNVYGAEIIIFGSQSDEPIEKILITDATDYDYLNTVVDNLIDLCVPYTKEDKEFYNALVDYLNNPTDEDKKDAYLDLKHNWSGLHDKGDLETILANSLTVGDDGVSVDTGKCVINATHLDGHSIGEFSRVNHTHSGYLPYSHSSQYGTSDTIGHVKIVDDLNGKEGVGSALSSKQGAVLDSKIKGLEDTVRNSWSPVYKCGKYNQIRIYDNPLLRLCVCEYNQSDLDILKKDGGIHVLEKENTIPNPPTSRVLTPVYRGDTVLMFNTDGSVKIHNLMLHDSINIHAQVMWHY
jgi:hypothetical protein